MQVNHPLSPVFDQNSRILILGTMPSRISRKEGFYYMHPQNRFWNVLSQVFSEDEPLSILEKTVFLHKHHIALFDVLASCEITGSSDASIKHAIPNDLSAILANTKITRIFTTGKTALKYYNQFLLEKTNIPAEYLPSPSAANCRMPIHALVSDYQILLEAVT